VNPAFVMASARSASLNDALRAEPLEAESFLSIFMQKGPKVKDLNENSPPCLRQSASRSQDQS